MTNLALLGKHVQFLITLTFMSFADESINSSSLIKLWYFGQYWKHR
jgi:hypothetical protein